MDAYDGHIRVLALQVGVQSSVVACTEHGVHGGGAK